MPDVIKVDEIQNFSLKSFSNYTGPSCKFNRSNIFYAPNGNGKTSLANGIKAEYLKTSYGAGLRIYDKNFVASQLLLEEDGNIRGVKADFGKKDVDLEKKIKTAEADRESIETDIRRLEQENRDLIATTETAIDDIFKRRKGKANIAKKTHKDGVHEKVVQLWIDDYEAALKKFPNEKYDEIDGEKNFNDNLDLVTGLRFNDLKLPSENELTSLDEILSKQYESIDIPSSVIVTWLEEGLHIHEEKDTCEFCGSSINIKELNSKIQVFLKDQQSLDRKKLEAIKESLQFVYRDIKDITDATDSTTVTLEKHEDAVTALTGLAASLGPLVEFGSTIGAKVSDMQKSIVLDSEALIKLLGDSQNSVETLQTVRDGLKKDIEDKINRLAELVKGAIGYEVKNSTVIAENCAKYKENLKEIGELKKRSATKKESARKLRESKSDLADFANYLNTIFEEIGINFKLVLSETSYILQHTLLGVDLAIDDISEGERNLLALIYFYYEMLSSDQKNLKDSVEIIIIDDPATSMDDENRFYILELVKSIIDNKSIQSFVLTHSWRDYCDLCYGKDEQQGVVKFEIAKVDGISSVEPCISILTPYKRLYKEVYDFSQKAVSEVEPSETLHMPNTMRRVLEEYIRFNFGIDLATQNRYNEIAEVIFEEDVINISANNEAKLKKLLSVCNILSHGTPQTRSVAEIHSSARFLVNRMKDINKYHHVRMKQA